MKYLSWTILVVFAALLLVGCSTEKKAAKKEAWLIANGRLAEVCARNYPVRDSVVVRDSVSFDTMYKEGEIIIDTVPCNKKDSIVYRSVKCPPHQVITKVIRKDSTIWQNNPAGEDRLKIQIANKEKIIEEKDKLIVSKDKRIDRNNWWKVACLITWALIAVGVAIRFFLIKRPL